jgi:hypothetical protein
MARLAALMALVALVLAGCGESEQPEPAAASAKAAPDKPVDVDPVGISRAGSVAQFADCGDWKEGTREQRLATIADIRGQETPQRSESAASPLSDERAYEVFQEACSPEWADSLRLYKLYVKVQGFAPLAEP